MWNNWNKIKPAPGISIVIVCDDGMSAMMGFALENKNGEIEVLDAEDGDVITYGPVFEGAIWCELPSDYYLSFTDTIEDC